MGWAGASAAGGEVESRGGQVLLKEPLLDISKLLGAVTAPAFGFCRVDLGL